MRRFLKEIQLEVQRLINNGEDPQAVYERVCEQYDTNKKDSRFLKQFIAKKVKHTVVPENRKEYNFSYHLYLISLCTAILVTIISKQHRIDALGISSLSSASLLTGFMAMNLLAWIYLYLAVRSLRFNLSVAYQALFIAFIDAIRLVFLLPVHWIETPFFALLRLIPPLLVIIFGSFYALNCNNPFSKNKNGEIVFYKKKKKFHIGQQK